MEETIMYYDLYSALSQELNDQQIGRYIGQQELREHIEKRDLALESLETEAAFLQFQLNKRNALLALSLLLIMLVSAFFALAFRQYRLKTSHQNMALEQKILRTQLNPHFIFNALGAIQHYMMDHAPEKAAGYLSKFSKLMRAILECSRTSHTSLSVEIDNMKHYLELQSLRFPKLFKYSIDVDADIQPDLIRIPSLLIQPLLENAVEHGLIPNHGGRIRVVIQQKEDHIIINVEDDGVGIDRHKLLRIHNRDKQSLGNTIINERLSLLNQKNKGKILFDIKNRYDLDENLSGTQASLKIPLTY
jgi:LytS/YehU family sensor histidine kinase